MVAFGLEFGQHDQGDHHPVVIELEKGCRVAQQYRRVEHVGDSCFCCVARADAKTINPSPERTADFGDLRPLFDGDPRRE